MNFDHNSLLVAVGACACAISFTFMVAWASARSNSFLATCAGAIFLLGVSVFLFLIYGQNASPLIGFAAGSVLLAGMSLNLAGARQFRMGEFDKMRAIIPALVMAAILALPRFWGMSGLASIAVNLLAAGMLTLIAREFWRCREEHIILTTGISGLYLLVAASFVACAISVAVSSPLVLDGPPDSLAETINLIVSILGIAAIGTLVIALNQNRLTRKHQDASETDALTGLRNRRALFDTFGVSGIPPQAAIIMIDLDHFKGINDKFGHAIGDAVLVHFADICRALTRSGDCVARIGGEEFIIILPISTPRRALALAEAVRTSVLDSPLCIDGQQIAYTVSIGVHTNALSEIMPMDMAIKTADKALYRAKNEGRNLVRTGRWLEAA